MSAFPPSPIRAPAIGPDGRMSPSWAKWFATLYQFTGSTGPANNADVSRLETLISLLDGRLDTAEIDIDALQATVGLIPTVKHGTAEYDFGSTPVYDAQFTITDANINASSFVSVVPGGAATGRTADDWQFDGASIGVVAGTGSATCYVTFSPGPIVGKRKFNYTVI